MMLDLYKFLVNLPDTVVLLSPELKILEATEEYLHVTSRTRDELIGNNFLEMFPDNPDQPESRNEHLLRASLMRALETKQADKLDLLRYDIPLPGGIYEERYWEAIHTPVLDDNGEVGFIIQKTSDVTERELAKKSAAERKRVFQFTIDVLPQLIYTLNPAGEITYYNQRWYDYTGADPNEPYTATWEEVVHPDDIGNAMSKFEAALKSGEDMQMELRIRNAQGIYRWHLSRGAAMRNENGEITLWVGSSTDIHDTRQLVMELAESNEYMSALSDQVKKAYSKAEAERQVLERLIMKAPVFFCVLKGPEHRFELVNDKYQKLLPNKDLIGKTVLEVLPEVVEQGFISLLDNVYNTGIEFVAERLPVKLDRYGSGELEEIYLTFIYQAILNEEQKVTGIMVCGYDVTDYIIHN
jgi:PAS domain S-box-containing protein